MPVVNENGRTMAGVIAELKGEAKEFVQTRIDMLRSELRDKIKAWKLAIPVIAIGLVLLATAWLVLTGALIAVISAAFYPSRFAYFFGFIIVGAVYALAGSIAGAFAWRELKEQGIMPQRTIQVLKDDRVWLQTEARGQA